MFLNESNRTEPNKNISEENMFRLVTFVNDATLFSKIYF
jgi:hypothetical protein